MERDILQGKNGSFVGFSSTLELVCLSERRAVDFAAGLSLLSFHGREKCQEE